MTRRSIDSCAHAPLYEGGRAIAANPQALTEQERLGLALYVGPGKCGNCHSLPETSNHVLRKADLRLRPVRSDPVMGSANRPQDIVNEVIPTTLIELMPMGNGRLGAYDSGFYNIGVRPSVEDIGRASSAPSGLPLSYTGLGLLKRYGRLPPEIAAFVPDTGRDEEGNILPLDNLFNAAADRVVTRGSFKTPMLRNQEYMGPYFHNGEDATLRHVVEFYARGGNFPDTNLDDLDTDITYLPELDASLGEMGEKNVQALVAFLARGLTDPRVPFQRAPFDHPEILLPVGVNPVTEQAETFITLPAVGASGTNVPIGRFLNLDPQAR